MTAVSFDISMSLDGYIAAPNRRPDRRVRPMFGKEAE
jgi:hypothetical protein